MNKIKTLKKPMTMKQLKEQAKDGRIIVVIHVEGTDLLDWDIEELNNHADDRILGKDIGGTLSDISYRALGLEVDAEGYGGSFALGSLLVQVDADVSDILDDYESELEEQRRDEKNGLYPEREDIAN